MRYSKLLIPTVKESPADAEIPSHKLMIRAGYIRKVASGTYTYLTLGWRSLRKVMDIVRQEMDAAGAQEISMPILQPIELWQATGREADYGPTMCKFTDRHGRVNALAPTAEEVVTSLAAAEVNSYKQLPVNLYQINTKFRDEFRPRFGVLRSREFIMKDAYSFDADGESLDRSYQAMYDAYCRIFTRCGVPYVVVEAEAGEIGGSGSHEFMVPCESGEDVIVHSGDGLYAANIEKAQVDAPTTPDDVDARRADVAAPEKVHTPEVGSIEAVCEFLKTTPAEMIKTLVYWRNDPVALGKLESLAERIAGEQAELKRLQREADATADDAKTETDSDKTHTEAVEALAAAETQQAKVRKLQDELCDAYGQLDVCVALVRGDHEANPYKIAAAVGHPVDLADERTIRELTGAAVGFAGPIGLTDKGVKMVVDPAVAAMVSGTTGANETDHHVRNVVPGRDFPLTGENVTVADVRNAAPGDTYDGKELQFSRGIEVGHVFKLGDKYSQKLSATFLDENGKARTCVMGCYGIGINRILASAIEVGNDDNGCALPISIAPFEVEIVQLGDSGDVVETAERLYAQLSEAGVDVLLDDRDARPGVKFKDADLIGIPLRLVVGDRGLAEGNVEIKRRTDAKPTPIPASEAMDRAMAIVGELRDAVS